MAEPSQAVPLYPFPNSGLFLAAVVDHIIVQAIASGHPKDLTKATHLENLQFCQVGARSVQHSEAYSKVVITTALKIFIFVVKLMLRHFQTHTLH